MVKYNVHVFRYPCISIDGCTCRNRGKGKSNEGSKGRKGIAKVARISKSGRGCSDGSTDIGKDG